MKKCLKQSDFDPHPPGCVQTIVGDTRAAAAVVLPNCFRSPIDGQQQPLDTQKIRKWQLSPEALVSKTTLVYIWSESLNFIHSEW